MRLRILLIVLTAISLTSCNTAPKTPDIHVCRPIFICANGLELKTAEEIRNCQVVDWAESYVLCIDRTHPNDSAKHERHNIYTFLLNKPLLMKNTDYVKISLWEKEITKWAAENCQQDRGN